MGRLMLDGVRDSSRSVRGMIFRTICALILLSVSFGTVVAAEEQLRFEALNHYWEKVSKAIGSGDLEGYRATCHPEAVLVSGPKKTSLPLADALVRWKPEFDATKAGTRTSKLEFRLSQRYGDETTAHESGIFLYSFRKEGAELVKEYIFFEALLVKREGQWLLVMEYQKSRATPEEWETLKK